MKRSVKAWLAIGFTAFGVVAIGGGAGVAWYLREQRDAYFTDADTIDRPVEEVSPRDILWRDPVDLPAVINTPADEYAPSLSPDGLALYFARRPGGDAAAGLDLFVCVKTPTGWSAPRALDALNSEGDDLDPVLSSDGGVLYFCSNRPGGSGDYDLWMTRRIADGWGPPVNLGPAINSRGNDCGPALAPDDTILYFASDRRGAAGAEPLAPGVSAGGVPRADYDLYRLDLTAAGAVPTAVAAINTVHDETAPAVSPAGDFLYFASDRPGGAGGFDLYRSRRVGGGHLPAVSLGPPVNTAGGELDPSVSLEGFGLHFAQGTGAGTGGAGAGYDLRYAVSREVFTRTDTYRAELELGTLWAELWPYLVWLIAAIFLLFLLAVFLQHFEFRKLSLLMRCLMVSLLIHMLLMVVFAFWGVSSVLSEWTRPGRGMRVVLTSPSVGSGLAGQIRATLDQPAADARWPEAAARRLAADEDLPADDTDVRADAQPVEASRIETAATPVVTASPEDAPARTAAPQPAATTAMIARAEAVAIDVPAEASRSARTEAASTSIEIASAPQPRVTRSGPRVTTAAIPAAAVGDAAPVEAARLDDAAAARVTARGRDAPAASAAPAPARPAALPDLADLEPVPVGGPSERADTRHAEATGIIAPPPVAGAPTSRARPDVAPGTDGLVAAHAAPAAVPPAAVTAGDPAPVTEAGPRHGTTAPLPAPRAARATGASRPLELALPAPRERPGDAPQRVPERDADLQAVARRAAATGRSAAPATPALDAADVRAAAAITPAGTSWGIAPMAADVAPARDAPARDAPATGATAVIPATDTTPAAARPVTLAFALPRLEESPVVSEPERAARRVPVQRTSPRRRWAAQTEPAAEAAAQVPRYTAKAGVTRLERDAARRVAVTDVPGERLDVEQVGMPVPASLDLDVKIPTRTAPLPDPYRHREPEAREEILEQMGGSRETEEAVALALDWLARHQGPDGRWDGEHFDDRCGRCDGTQRVKCDVALTGLSVLSFVAADHTHLKDGPYRQTVERGLRWLVEHQGPDGDLMDGESLYSHGIAAIALAEAYGMTRDETLRRPVEAAMSFIYEARNRAAGGWRYRPGQAGDTSVMGWQVMALTSAKRAGLDVPDEAFRVADRWLDLVHRPSRPGTYAYQPRREVTPAMTAEGMFVRQLLGAARDEPRMRGSAAYILEHPPSWQPDANTYYWYYATLALFQHQGSEWRQWNEGIKLLLVGRQRRDGRAAGSWDPDGRWAGVAGRVYQTAIATLTLEVYYRYLPLYARRQ